MFFVVQGEVLIVLADGRQAAVLGPGNFFGEMGMLLKAPRTATCVAVGHVELFKLPVSGLEAAMADHPELGAPPSPPCPQRPATRSRLQLLSVLVCAAHAAAC